MRGGHDRRALAPATWQRHRRRSRRHQPGLPWLHARAGPAEGFAGLRPLLAGELRLLDHLDEDLPAWEAACSRVRDAVSLHAPDGHLVPEFLLHIDGEQAWWRWS